MKIQYASDLHLEFFENSRYLKNNPLKPAGDVLVLAGDIECLNRDNFYNNHFWDYVSDNFKEVIVVVGNHEFYHGYDLNLVRKGKVCSVRKNVNYYYNSVIQLDNISLIVSPLWSYVPVESAGIVKQGVSDFHKIIYNGSKLTIEDFNHEHERCLAFIKEEVAKNYENPGAGVSSQIKKKRIVVATHHVPSFQLSSPDFYGSQIAGAFTVELSKYIESSPIDYWIYGHSHRNIDRVIGKTKCVTNQLGYLFYDEHHSFDNAKVIL
jgi:predicted phosphodiesterase